ncbi:hypothetical protein RM533_13175 [Croceicoccus sp. F390]|uniref:Uncharacterized protein n=1 Tax=Croceicoccus esteveae TaxID=3075597 RepID=A0ABU2ZKJ4_9SPHN|nr:hypothetical protein [Croceicoccus sp. F390]MDT0577118.1 hypothetical protein [Croceicoccus sp. F390]
MFGELAFSLPDGIDYISDDENVHAGSLLVFHSSNGALHVDDTFNVLPPPASCFDAQDPAGSTSGVPFKADGCAA